MDWYMLTRGKLLLLLGCVILTTGCGSSKSGLRTETESTANASLLETQLRDVAHEWQGTPYVLGGTSKRGVDCSGFVQSVYSATFDIELPRTTSEQVRIGKSIDKTSLQPGDLVFFRPPGKYNHVGIYVGAGEFAHASTSSGVMVSHLDETYWSKAYWTSRKILDTRSPTSTQEEISGSSDTTRRRTGW